MVEKRERRHGSLLWRLDNQSCNDEVFLTWLVLKPSSCLFDSPSPFSLFFCIRPIGWFYSFQSVSGGDVLYQLSYTMYFGNGTTNDYKNCASTKYSVTGSGAVVVNTTNTAGCGGTLTQPFCEIPP